MRTREDIQARITLLEGCIDDYRTDISEAEQGIRQKQKEIEALRVEIATAPTAASLALEAASHFDAAEMLGQLRIPGAIEDKR